MTPIRVLIVDDHTLFREGLRAIFMTVQDIEVIGEAASGRDAIDQVQRLQPDVILMDIQMDDINGMEACHQILGQSPEIKIIMLTMLEDHESLLAAMRCGARGYVLKGADKTEVLNTIRAVARGDVLFGSAIAHHIIGLLRKPNAVHVKSQKPSPFPELTEREHEILDLIAQGLDNHHIADRLNIAVKTVSNHISNIFNKLQVTDRTQAALKAREAGLGQDEHED